MATHKFVLTHFLEDINYTLFALHCTIADYRLAFMLNQMLAIKLKRTPQNLEFNRKANYALYEWNDPIKGVVWNLVSNVSLFEETVKPTSNNLFSEEYSIANTNYLIPEKKEINYFLKVSSDSSPLNEAIILKKINQIPQIITAYCVNTNQLKSKDNLIFN